MAETEQVKQFRWGMIGCGSVCEVKSAPAYYQHPNFEITGVTSRRLDKARDYAKRHNIERVYETPEALINSPDIDAIYIATPVASHCELALKVAAAAKPCCVEKPMALNGCQSQQMVEAFAKQSVPLYVAYYRRSLPRFKQVKDWLSNHAIGDVRSINWLFAKPAGPHDIDGVDNWRTQPEVSGGGYFVDLASHGLDLFQFLLGDITQVQGISTNQQNLYAAEDAVNACWHHEDGILGSGNWNFGARERLDRVSILGSQGEIYFSVFSDQPLELVTSESTQSITIANPSSIQQFHVDNIHKDLTDQQPHPALGCEALKTDLIIDQILRR